MLDWFPQTIAEEIVALVLAGIVGYAIRSRRGRIKISLSTHIEQSWTDRRIRMSIRNHGSTAAIVDSWTVHIPAGELLPGLSKPDEEAESGGDERRTGFRRVAGWIRYRLFKRDRIAMQNELSDALAASILGQLHLRHELLDPGSTVRIRPGESEVRDFPRTGVVLEQSIVSDAELLAIIPSCHVVGRRRRIWGWPSYLGGGGGGSVPFAMEIGPPPSDQS